MTNSGRRYNRRSIRLKDYDYRQSGAYFVTFCTLKRQCLLQANTVPYEISTDIWLNLPQFFQGIALDEFVVMPNHIHFVVWLQSGDVGAGLAPALSPATAQPSSIPDTTLRCSSQPAGQPTSQPVGQSQVGQPQELPLRRTWMIPTPTKPQTNPRLGDVVGGYKSLVSTVYLNWMKQNQIEDGVAKFWQRNYYEHIIRNERELTAIRRYIRENPAKWNLDRDNSMRPVPLPEAKSVQDYLDEIDNH